MIRCRVLFLIEYKKKPNVMLCPQEHKAIFKGKVFPMTEKHNDNLHGLLEHPLCLRLWNNNWLDLS